LGGDAEPVGALARAQQLIIGADIYGDDCIGPAVDVVALGICHKLSGSTV
jgi:hypothetical protein